MMSTLRTAVRFAPKKQLSRFSAQRFFSIVNVSQYPSNKMTITELLGDGIGPELSSAIHKMAETLPVDIDFVQVDWSLENRKKDADKAMDDAFNSMNQTKLCLKYPTVTAKDLPGTAGRSPNAIIRRKCNFSVIYRPAISIPGISSHFREAVNLHIIRVATGGTYDDPGQMIGLDSAVSIRMVERLPCMQAAQFAFELAKKRGYHVTSASKYTIQKTTDGLFEQVIQDVRKKFPEVPANVELFDALLGKVIIEPEDYRVVVCLNEYGDFLSDMASGLVGSLGTGASGNFSFNKDMSVDIAMFDPAGGTAPDIAGQDKCNPTAIFLAFGMLLDHAGRYDLGHSLRLCVLDAIRQGETTGDLGGSHTCSSFTNHIVQNLPLFLNETAPTLNEYYLQHGRDASTGK